jgi:hypothetical protein
MKYLLKRGAGVGMAAGAMMAMFSMLAMAVSGNGFWTPLNAIAHTLWKGAPLDGRFNWRCGRRSTSRPPMHSPPGCCSSHMRCSE